MDDIRNLVRAVVKNYIEESKNEAEMQKEIDDIMEEFKKKDLIMKRTDISIKEKLELLKKL